MLGRALGLLAASAHAILVARCSDPAVASTARWPRVSMFSWMSSRRLTWLSPLGAAHPGARHWPIAGSARCSRFPNGAFVRHRCWQRAIACLLLLGFQRPSWAGLTRRAPPPRAPAPPNSRVEPAVRRSRR